MNLLREEVSTYLAQLASPNWLDRLAAVSALKDDSDDPKVRAALVPMLQDRSDTVRQLAAVALKVYDREVQPRITTDARAHR